MPKKQAKSRQADKIDDKTIRRLLDLAQWQRMPVDKIMKIQNLLGLSTREATDAYGSLWSLTFDQVEESKNNAKIVQDGYKERPRGDWGEKVGEVRDFINKTQGNQGELAFKDVLKELGIKYKYAKTAIQQKYNLPADFTLYPSGIVIELKTQNPKSNHLQVNKNTWSNAIKHNSLPDLVFAVKRIEPDDDLPFTWFKGYIDGDQVTKTTHKTSRCNQWPCPDRRPDIHSPAWVWRYNELIQPKDFTDFIQNLAEHGKDYVKQITTK